ncbi:hypothetical protein ACJIZ3_002169 [Penstemon smallii]|uniref:Non-haem dioxygenase N-terminal domain-containing protein n=1 Tax=Penstemon smallii TaxID=265156 RepID=A0ABD3U760_9LAMI
MSLINSPVQLNSSTQMRSLMDSTLMIHYPTSKVLTRTNRENGVPIFDTSLLEKHSNLPTQFHWPHEDLAYSAPQDELKEQPINLKGFYNGDQEAINLATKQIKLACLKHGFFQVINHGVDTNLIRAAPRTNGCFLQASFEQKGWCEKKTGWPLWVPIDIHQNCHGKKHSPSLIYIHANTPGVDVVNYIKSELGNEFEEAGCVYQKYCESMKNLALVMLELLAMSLGVDRLQFKEFFEDGSSIMRGNNYPPCKEAGLTLGTGPHSDPAAKLHRLEGGPMTPLKFIYDVKWKIQELCTPSSSEQGEREKKIIILVYFVNPKEDKIVRPLPLPLPLPLNKEEEEERLYPDFTWAADTTTFHNFVFWRKHNHLIIN